MVDLVALVRIANHPLAVMRQSLWRVNPLLVSDALKYSLAYQWLHTIRNTYK